MTTRRREVPAFCLTVSETAKALRLSENELRPLIRDGVVPTIRWHDRGHLLVPVVAIERLIEQKLSAAASAAPPSVSAVPEPGAANGAAGSTAVGVRGSSPVAQQRVSSPAPAGSKSPTQKGRRVAPRPALQNTRPTA